MKKLLFIALSVMFCLGSAAQNESEYEEVDEFVKVSSDSSAVPMPPKPRPAFKKHTPAYQQQEQQQTGAQLVEINALIDKLKELTNDSAANALLDMPENIYKPLR